MSELLERRAELQALDDAIAAAHGGHGRLVVVEGPAGVGKTALLAAGRRRAQEFGCRALWARASELEQSFAYGVVRQLFEAVVAKATGEERAGLFAGAADLAAPLFHETSLLPAGPGGDEVAMSRRHGLYWLAVNLAEQAPLAIAVDDVHWCDAASVRWLAYVTRRLEGLPVLVVVSRRPAEPGVDAASLADLSADASPVLRPAPLSASGSAALVERLLDAPPDVAFAVACHAASAGNPLLLREILRTLSAEGVAPTDANTGWVARLGPQAVSGTVGRRLAHLPVEATALARALAVLGDDVGLPAVARVAGLSQEAAVTALGRLMRADVVRDGDPPSFVHPVICAAVYEGMPTSERQQAHAAAAEVLARSGARGERVAAQLLLVPPDGRSSVVTTLRQAGRTALVQGAPESAAAYLRRALQEPPVPGERADVLAELGSAERLVHGPSAVEHLREAVGLARDDSRRRGEIALELGRLLAFTRRGDEAVEVFEKAIADLAPSDADLRQRLQAAMLHVGAYDPRLYPRAAGMFDQLRTEPQDAGLGGRTLSAMLAYHDARAGGSRDEALLRVETALAAGPVPPGAGLLLLNFAGFVLTAAEHFDDAGRVLREGLAHARTRGSVLEFAASSCLLAHAALRRGAVLEAEADARQALEAAEAHGFEHARLYALSYLAQAALLRGHAKEAALAIEQAGFGDHIPDTAHLHFLLEARARVRAHQGDTQGAASDFLELGRRFSSVGGRNPAFLSWRSQAALALRQLGDDAEARRLAVEEVELAQRWGAGGALGHALRVAGLAEGGQCGLDLLRQAVDVLEGSPAVLVRAEALTDFGAALRRGNRRAEARDPLHRGQALARQCGAAELEKRAHDELLATGARPRRTAVSGVQSLTPSEHRVATMAAEGMPNRELAQALFVTEKTVEMHLSNAYRKLGISSRTRLADALTAEAEP